MNDHSRRNFLRILLASAAAKAIGLDKFLPTPKPATVISHVKFDQLLTSISINFHTDTGYLASLALPAVRQELWAYDANRRA